MRLMISGDLDESAAQHYKQLGWALNWDSSARFPWHGEWIPTAEDGFGEQWLSCFAHAPPDGHANEVRISDCAQSNLHTNLKRGPAVHERLLRRDQRLVPPH